MAKHNFVFLNGQVIQDAKVFKNEETGEYLRAICPILTIRGVRDFGNNIDHLKYDTPVIMSGNPEVVKRMAEWKKGDMVDVKGAITTKDIIKSTTCKHCGYKNQKKGNLVFVSPIYVGVHEKQLSDEQGQALLKERCEISNCATVIGPVCREPQTFKTEKGLVITTYQVAIRRKFRIKDESAEIRTDFPWVKSYGAIASNDAEVLKKGSYVFLDGMLQTRDLKRIQECEKCGESYEWNDSAMEIVPFATEYLRDFRTEEEIKQMRETAGKAAIEEVLNENIIDSNKPLDTPDLDEEDEENSGDNLSIATLN